MRRLVLMSMILAMVVGLSACTVRPEGQKDVVDDYDQTFPQGPGIFTGRSGKLVL
jgi:hypothetical protein